MNKLSIVIPVFNEEKTLGILVRKIKNSMPPDIELVQILFVDDGSMDGSFDMLRMLCEEDQLVGVVRLPVNRGKAEALDAGFRHVFGDIIITMDADLQDDASEIPRFIAKLREGYDLVSGWKEDRQDQWHRTWPSKLFNAVVTRVFRIPLRDFNCGYKAYRRSLVDQLSLYGELHRYIPVLAQSVGARMVDLSVHHLPRRHGESKYGGGRFLKAFLDMFTVLVTTRFLRRPLHLFGSAGIICSFVGGAMLMYLAALRLGGGRPITDHLLSLYGMILLIAGVQILSLGLVAELFLKLNHNQGRPRPASIKLLGCVNKG